MKPVTREEQYLNRLTGEEQEIPEEPVTREEQYLARLCGQMNSIPEKPVTRREEYLANLCGEDVIIPEEQVTRMEQYMAFAAGARETKPEKPVTREEMYWDKYQGGDVPEEKTIAFTDIITVTDALARAAVDLQTEITAQQNLNGYEYPWVGGAGKNLLNVELPITLSGEGNIGNKPCVLPSGTYTYTSKTSTSQAYVLTVHNGNGTEIARIFSASASADFLSVTFTTTEESAYIRCYYNGATTITHMQIESGSAFTGYAPYENICPISGRTEVNVTRTGKNLFDVFAYSAQKVENGVTFTINNDGSVTLNGTSTRQSQIYWGIPAVVANRFANMLLDSFETAAENGVVVLLEEAGGSYTNYAENRTVEGSVISSDITSLTTRVNLIIRVASGTTLNNFKVYPMVRPSSSSDEFAPYEGDTFNTELGRTVYGGTLDLTTGELTITHAYVDLGDLTWTTSLSEQIPNLFGAYINNKKDGYRNFKTTSYRTVKKHEISLANGEATGITKTIGEPMTYIFVKDERATTAEEFTTLVTGQKMVYELATPQTISLTPTEVQMLENNNTICADAGRVQLTYLSKAAQRVQSMNASLKANTLKITKAITGGVKA